MEFVLNATDGVRHTSIGPDDSFASLLKSHIAELALFAGDSETDFMRFDLVESGEVLFSLELRKFHQIGEIMRRLMVNLSDIYGTPSVGPHPKPNEGTN